MSVNELIKGVVKTTKKKPSLLRVLSNLDDVVFVLYTDHDTGDLVLRAKIKEEDDESEQN